MTRMNHIEHRFVEFIPTQLEEGVLYISREYATAVHRCCCGCGSKVVTPLSAAGWRITESTEGLSVRPSIGNWSFPCQSHYWITRNAVEWDAKWGAPRIEAARRLDAAARAEELKSAMPDGVARPCTSIWDRISRRVRRALRRVRS